jgi:hypothetical protein
MKIPKYMQERYLKVPREKRLLTTGYGPVISLSMEEISIAWNEAAKDGWYNIRFEIDLEDGDYDGYYSAGFYIRGERDETVKEFEKRLDIWKQGEDNKRKAAAERRKEKEKRERETYERLKKKYGDK